MLKPGLFSQQAVVPYLEVARGTFHCKQYIFVLTKDYILFSSSEMYLGASSATRPTVCVVAHWFSH